MFDFFANPSRFMRFTNRLLLPLVVISSISATIGLYLGLFLSPADYQQGDTVRIIYIHVPAAWLGLFGYIGLGLCGLFYIVWRHPLADIAARAIAPKLRASVSLSNTTPKGFFPSSQSLGITSSIL